MKPEQSSIIDFLHGDEKIFFIPVYQRNYTWTKINCEKLWQDIENLSNGKRNSHFLGTIVAINQGYVTKSEYAIVDGQQRLTTVSILLIALMHYIKKNPTSNLPSDRIENYLINKYSQTQDKRIRLKPNNEDKDIFESLFDETNVNKNTSNIINNYNYFKDKIEENTIIPEEIFDSLKKLIIVIIALEKDENPQLIFESLNSTGVNLTAGDLIRNYILMDLSAEWQEKLYKEYWIKIEELTDNDIEEFTRQYLIYKFQTTINIKEIYFKFKEYVSNNYVISDNQEKEKLKIEILKDLLYFAKFYSYFTQKKKFDNIEINDKLNRLFNLEIGIQYSYLFDVFNDLDKNIITIHNVNQILMTIESYIFRKKLTSGTQGFNKFFPILAKEIKKYPDWKNEYINILNFILLNRTVTQTFPTNEEFENALMYKEIYLLRGIGHFLLESLENFHSQYKIENIEDLEMEHIMPSNLTKEWKASLGENYNEMHKKYVNTLGNLSLITSQKNKENGNKFKDDKDKIDYQNNKLYLNLKINGTDWNENSIILRAKKLTEDAIKIWPYPITNITKNINQEKDLFDLSSDYDFSYKKPSILYLKDNLKDKEIKLSTWRDFTKEVFKFIYETSPSSFTHRDFTKESFVHTVEFLPNKYIGSGSANWIVAFLKKECEEINIKPENIMFEIK